MAERLLNTTVGEWEVSTIKTDAGGASPSRPSWSPFSSADYVDETPWPFETMVFKGSRIGRYHEAFASLEEARTGHARIVEALKSGTLEVDKGVSGVFGTPSLTAEEWAGKRLSPNRESEDEGNATKRS